MDKDTSNKKPQTDDFKLLLEATKEITKAVADVAKEMTNLKEEWQKWRRAGKFSLILCLTGLAASAWH